MLNLLVITDQKQCPSWIYPAFALRPRPRGGTRSLESTTRPWTMENPLSPSVMVDRLKTSV
jgi:hypothetical protein